MRDNGGITLSGVVLDVVHKSGTTTKGQPYSFHILSVLTGKTVSEVRWPENEDLGNPPKEDDRINVAIELDVFNGRQQIEAKRVLPSSLGARAATPAAS